MIYRDFCGIIAVWFGVRRADNRTMERVTGRKIAPPLEKMAIDPIDFLGYANNLSAHDSDDAVPSTIWGQTHWGFFAEALLA